MKKRILALLLATVIMLGIIVLPASAAPTGISVTVNRQTAVAGDTLVWSLNVTPVGGPLQTKIDVYCDGNLIHSGTFTSGTVHSYTTKIPGNYYAEATVLDYNDLASMSTNSLITKVAKRPRPNITSIAADSSTRIRLSWSPVAGVDGYRVYMSTSSSGPFNLKGTTTATTLLAYYLTPGKVYYFYVAGYNIVKNVKYTSTLNSGIKRAVPLGPATITSITNPSKGRVWLSWKPVTSATQYVVYRSTSLSGSYTRLYSTTALSYTDTGLIPGRVYYYRIMAAKRIFTNVYYAPMGPARSIKVLK